MTKVKPSRKAHHSAITLAVCPIDLKNPLTQIPWQSLITPPPPTLPGFPHDASSVFSLCHPTNSLVHLTRIAILEKTSRILLTWKNYSLAWPMQILSNLGFGMVFSNTTLFLFFHKHQTSIRNKVHQGIDVLCLAVLRQFFLSQFSRFSLKEFTCEIGTPNLHHKSRATSQSQRRWTMVSSCRLHIGQVLS